MEQKKISQKPIIIRMSESGRCPKALSAELLGYEPESLPAFVEKAAEEGKWHEDRIVSQLVHVSDRQKELTLDFPSFTLLGHIDGIYHPNLNNPNSNQLLEIKSMSQYEFDRWMKEGFKGFPNYASQITCYMEATELKECLYIVKNRSSGYEDREVLSEPPSDFSALINKLTWVEECVDGKHLAESEFDPQSIECRRCEYKALCVPEAKELTPVEEADLSAAVKNWRQGKQLISEGQELVDKARETLENHTRATNILKWRHSGLAILLVHIKEQTTYPKANLLKLFTEEQLEPAGKIKEAYDQLRIDDLEKDNG